MIRSESGQQLQFVETVKFLGVHNNRGMKVHTHCQKIADKAKVTFQGFRKIGKANWGVGNRELTLLFKAIFISTVTYVTGAWAGRATKTGLAKLLTAQQAALAKVTRTYSTISTPALLVISTLSPSKWIYEKKG